MKDPYTTLGLAKSASQEEIKNAYRALAKKFHPDMNPGDKQAQKKFQEINSAYEILGDPANRKKFDRGEWAAEDGFTGEQGGARKRAGPFYRNAKSRGDPFRFEFEEGFDPRIFEQLFKGARGETGQGGFEMPSHDEHYLMEVSLRDAVLGGEREILLPNGKRLMIRIPKGCSNGQLLRFPEQAGPPSGRGPAGDIYVEFSIQRDPRFQMEGAQLKHELLVPIDIAVLGGELPVPTPEGQVSLKIPPRSNSGRRIRIPGKGLFVRGSSKRADLLVTLKLTLPENMDSSFEELIRAWRGGRQ